ncbi:unnamed protein product [Dovyalis caffra]|uniref:Uncharacterized protein n=1 Tax=Dovyalis caffra TaxID=77055 RepID=A0AAV1SA77_9ROSI|nr:unnamed protein product [Dovyalis caffra]
MRSQVMLQTCQPSNGIYSQPATQNKKLWAALVRLTKAENNATTSLQSTTHEPTPNYAEWNRPPKTRADSTIKQLLLKTATIAKTPRST